MFDDPRWSDDPRDRGDDDARERDSGRPSFGRGPGSSSARHEHAEDDSRNRHDQAHGLDRDRDARDRGNGLDPRDVFTRTVDLPRGRDRELVHDSRGRVYALRGSESRTLATIGAFRVVSARDLPDQRGRAADPRMGDLRHLREEGLVRTAQVDGHRDVACVLTKDGRDLLESRRHHCGEGRNRDEREHDRDHAHRQTFYAGLKKPREVEHDVQVYRAYLREAERVVEEGARIDRVVLDYELKREYQKWLHEGDRERDDADGRPDRTRQEVEDWARDYDLPYFDDQVHFPDLRIEYEHPDGRWDHRDVEVTTLHYRGRHGAAATRAGFSCYRGGSARLGGRGGGGGRGSHADPHLAEEFLD
jgi:hypothetical protein